VVVMVIIVMMTMMTAMTTTTTTICGQTNKHFPHETQFLASFNQISSPFLYIPSFPRSCPADFGAHYENQGSKFSHRW